MRRLSTFFVAVTLILSISVLAGCENQDKTQELKQNKTELEKAQMELEQIKKDSTQLDKYIADMKTEINNLKIENQKLIAESKRLEAEIIDLRLELGQIPDADSKEVLDRDVSPTKQPGKNSTGQDADASEASQK
ncbi:MAG: hypothetical protein RIG61_10935 [Deltaproteobacteria bacterium]